MLHTITIILKEKYEKGRDPFNAPIYEYADTPVEGCLVAPLKTEDIDFFFIGRLWLICTRSGTAAAQIGDGSLFIT